MQISAISALKTNFGNSMPIPKGAVLRYDEGQPYIAFPVGMRDSADSFERREKPVASAEYSSIQEAIENRALGFRHEDFLY